MQSIPDLKHGRRQARIGLRGYIFCCLGLVAALPVLVLGVIQVTKWEAKQLDDVDQERQFVAQTLVQGIGQIVDGHVRAVETLAGQVEARGSLDKAAVDELNAGIRGYNHGDDVRKEILGDAGIADDGSILDAVSLNNLDDWTAFHKSL